MNLDIQPTTKEKSIEEEYISYSFDNYTQNISIDKKRIALYYKSHLIYVYTDLDTETFEEYYSPKGRYCFYKNNSETKLSFTETTYLKEEDALCFEFNKKLQKIPAELRNSSYKPYLEARDYYLNRTHSCILKLNDHYIIDSSDERHVEYEKLEKMYHCLRFVLPYVVAKDVLLDVLELLHSYILTSTLDTASLAQDTQFLSAFDFCNKSRPLLENFLQHPEEVSLADLISKLTSYCNNISNIIAINCKDEELEFEY